MKTADSKRLWAPWRIKYIRNPKSKKCIFCHPDKYVIFKTVHSIAMLNIFPYNNGHIMIAPIKHIKDFSLLNNTELLDLFKTVEKAKSLLDKVLQPQGYNIGINLSRAAGAGIPGHLHVHIVPRWNGDTNFMLVIAKTKVISQSLEELHKQLKYAKSKTA